MQLPMLCPFSRFWQRSNMHHTIYNAFLHMGQILTYEHQILHMATITLASSNNTGTQMYRPTTFYSIPVQCTKPSTRSHDECEMVIYIHLIISWLSSSFVHTPIMICVILPSALAHKHCRGMHTPFLFNIIS